MISKEQFISDDRFIVSREDTERIFSRNVKKYTICDIKLKDIKKKIGNKIISIDNTDSYKFLNNEINSDDYNNYCKNETYEYENHSLESFNKLVNEFKDYSLEKDNAIVIDQFGLIRDGQHRASILLKQFGPEYKIPVVKVYYTGLRLKTYLQLFFYFVNKNRKGNNE